MKMISSQEEFDNKGYFDPITLECESCHKPFQRIKKYVYRVIRGQKPHECRFCNQICSKMDRTNKALVQLVCKECGKQKTLLRHDLAKQTGNFCSQTCANRYGAKHETDEQRLARKERGCEYARRRANCAEQIVVSRHGEIKTRFTIHVDAICEECRCTFSKPARSSRKFCSKQCVDSACRRKWITGIYRSKNSEGVKRAYQEGRKEQSGGTTRWLNYKDIKVQGSYELRSCYILDEWVSRHLIFAWRYSPRRILYVGPDDQQHSYLIDFEVTELDGTVYYIETKGRVQERDSCKWEACKQQGLDLRVWYLKQICEQENLLCLKYDKHKRVSIKVEPIFGAAPNSPSLQKNVAC